ncbi:hypothetical protein K435DRAFT_853320 [Dendrothele bispora CBS 962.96]|uniref:BHLH domain-containing protein n=1 Tax=Dendrothele bispora (strain CBS 962.96) TaxID=1314807 RepID=A0A4S8MGT8_DENBC|nr:hypothetical protein K435DRAFT_853320 [Dendrothele bispora CBS 962.96]
MTLPINIPSPSSPGASPASDDSTQPRTPVSPTLHNNNNIGNNDNSSNNNSNSNNPTKRKPSRRANTAERRATHNAVERQRRETLNGRFLDLAALLPNLSQIRRPSKSSIVNSSIAHVHASRRHRLLASRELRLLKLESDALRRELNEWRDRAGIPRVEEPVRGEGFSMVLSGELEVLPASLGGMVDGMDGIDEEDGEYAYADEIDGGAMGGAPEEMYRHEDVVMPPQPPSAMGPVPTMHHPAVSHPQMATMQRSSSAHAVPTMRGGPHPPNVQERMERLKRLERLDRLDRSANGGPGPMIASPTSMQFDSPAVPGMYEPTIEAHAVAAQQMQQMGGMRGMMQQMQGGGMMGMGFDQQGQGKFGGVNPAGNGAMVGGMRARSASMSGSSSGSASPPLHGHGHGGYGATSDMQQSGEWMHHQQMGMNVHGHVNHGHNQGMMGGMGGMNAAGVAFAMMM